MKRAVLIYNPEATTTTRGAREVIARALSSELQVEVAQTKRRGHAMHLAAGAAHEGFDLVVLLGGDGTLNEAINGLAGTGTPLAPLPGGGTNVFARTLGYPTDPVEATARLLDAIRRGAPPRTVNVGRVNGRAFGFCAGVGFDAEVVRLVERRMRMKKRIGEWFFVTSALRVLWTPPSRPRPSLELHGPGGERARGLRIAICGNSDPYTFLRRRPFRMTPGARLDGGLDLTATATVRTAPLLRVVLRAFGDGGHTGFRSIVSLQDVDGFELRSDRPAPLQVDGDFAGEDTIFRFGVEREALRVLA